LEKLKRLNKLQKLKYIEDLKKIKSAREKMASQNNEQNHQYNKLNNNPEQIKKIENKLNPYTILNISKEYDKSSLKKAYLKAALHSHPDMGDTRKISTGIYSLCCVDEKSRKAKS
tara:strand:- start:24 stop:368 length:345 start_codon:yes stop_codon:yes gene_type:complete